MSHRGFTVLNKVARELAQHHTPRALALARKRRPAVAQGYREGLCE
jgi:hypothetical protein